MRTLICSLLLCTLTLPALAQINVNVAPRLDPIAITPGRGLQYTVVNGVADTTRLVTAELRYNAGGRFLAVQPAVSRSQKNILITLSPAQSLSLPAVSTLQINVGNRLEYIADVVASYSGKVSAPGSVTVTNYVVGGGGSSAANPLAPIIQQYKLSGVQPGYTITHGAGTLLVNGTAFWTDTRQADPLWRVVIDTPNTVKLTGPPGEQFFGTVVLEPFPTSN